MIYIPSLTTGIKISIKHEGHTYALGMGWYNLFSKNFFRCLRILKHSYIMTLKALQEGKYNDVGTGG